MGSKQRRTALKAAAAYYGFSSNDRSLPDAAEASVNTVLDGPDPTEFLEALADRIKQAWPENVGAISRTARLGHTDFAYYANEVRRSRGDGELDPAGDEIARAMEHFVGDGVCLVEIERRGETKRLLVNTNISS